MKKPDYPLLLAALIPIVLVGVMAQKPGIPNVADGLIHLLRQVDFDRAIRGGMLAPRWGADLYLGFGYPLYNFAPPLFAYLVEAFFLTGVSMDDALKLAVILVIELHSIGMFLFMRPKVGAYGALAAAALNVYAPFRLREAFVSGGNYPQFLAMALFPFILWAFDGIARTGARRYLFAAVLSYSALIVSHVFHALIFTPIAVGYVLMRLMSAQANRRAWAMALAAGLLAVMLTGFFWLPVVVEQPLVRASAESFQRASDFHQRFLTPARLLSPPRLLDGDEANADVPISLGWAQMAMGMLGIVSILWDTLRGERRFGLSEPVFLGALFGVATFLQLPQSALIWERAPFLPLAEFPWRFMGLSIFALAALGGYAVRPSSRPSLSFMRQTHRMVAQPSVITVLVIAFAIVTVFPYAYAPRGFARVGTPGADAVLQFELSTGALGLTTLDEYLPQTVKELPADRPAPLSRPKIELPPSMIVAADWSPGGESALLDLPQATAVRFRIFNYPGWTAYLDGKQVPTTTQRDGTFSVEVPAGRHRLEARFEETPERQAGYLISAVALIALILSAALKLLPIPTTGETREDDASEPDVVALAALALLLVMVCGVKFGVVDVQGWLNVSRYQQPLVVFDERIELLAGETDEQTVARGGELHARFFWRPTVSLDNDYKVIAQLIAPDGRAVAGSDKQHPGDPVTQGETPTSQIAAGKYLRDEHAIAIPAAIEAGQYALKAGLYDPRTGKRLRLPNGETLFALATIEVR